MHAHGTQLDRTQPTERAVSRAVTSVEVLGFVSWTGSGLALGAIAQRCDLIASSATKPGKHDTGFCDGAVLYVLWAYVPAQTLASVGITYYPSTYWATALPLWCCLALVFCCVAYEWYSSLCFCFARAFKFSLLLRESVDVQWSSARLR